MYLCAVKSRFICVNITNLQQIVSVFELYRKLLGDNAPGDSLIKKGAETLNALAEKIDTTRMKSPAFKMIMTVTGEYAYRRPEDGIYVVPIGCLKP